MVRVKLIFVVLFLWSCGQYKNYDKKYFIETPELEGYVKRFEALSEGSISINDTGLVVVFGTTKRPAVGTCTVSNSKSPEVVIDKTFWSKASAAAKENLMFHELGHCLLKRAHNPTKKDGVPVSIMYQSLIPSHYKTNKKTYLDELFSVFGDWLALTDEEYTWTCGEVGRYDN